MSFSFSLNSRLRFLGEQSKNYSILLISRLQYSIPKTRYYFLSQKSLYYYSILKTRYFSSEPRSKIIVKFITPPDKRLGTPSKEVLVQGEEGQNLLSLAHENDIELEGACEGSLACSTCHVILDKKSYDLLSEPTDEENDMLDLAFGLTETSRLGCQVCIDTKTDGLIAQIPSVTRNMAVDGYKPPKH